jgi:hypothetical protein
MESLEPPIKLSWKNNERNKYNEQLKTTRGH